MDLHKLNENTLLADLGDSELSSYISSEEIETLKVMTAPGQDKDALDMDDDFTDLLSFLVNSILEDALTTHPEYKKNLHRIFCEFRYISEVARLLLVITSGNPTDAQFLCDEYIKGNIETVEGKLVGLSLGNNLITKDAGTLPTTPSSNHFKSAAPHDTHLTAQKVEDTYAKHTANGIVAEFKNLESLLIFAQSASDYHVFTTKLYTYNNKYYVLYNISRQSVLSAFAYLKEGNAIPSNPSERTVAYPLNIDAPTFPLATNDDHMAKTLNSFKNKLLVDLEESSTLSNEIPHLLQEFGELILSDNIFPSLRKIIG